MKMGKNSPIFLKKYYHKQQIIFELTIAKKSNNML